MADKEKNIDKSQADIQQPVNIEIGKRMKTLQEVAPYVKDLPPGYLEGISRLAEYGSVVYSSGMINERMAKVLAENAKTLSQVDVKALADAYSIYFSRAKDVEDDTNTKKISVDQKKFNDLITIAKPNSIEELVKCLKRRNELKNIWEEYINDDSSQFVYDSMTLEESHMYKIRDTLNKLEEYCISYQESFPEYNVKRLEKNIDYLIKQHNMSRYDLELVLNVAQSYLSRAFNPTDEKRRISVDVLWKICNFFNVSMDTILKEELQSNTIAIDSKTSKFIETILKATQVRKIKWEPYKITSYMSIESREAVKFLLLNKELTADDRHIETKAWMNIGDDRIIFFVYVECENSTYYYFGTNGSGGFRWLINTKDKNQKRIEPMCQELYELIIAFESAGYLSEEEEDIMDQIMKGLEDEEVKND